MFRFLLILDIEKRRPAGILEVILGNVKLKILKEKEELF